jgi:signal transduction histidine kinase/HAMP domain-containing protein
MAPAEIGRTMGAPMNAARAWRRLNLWPRLVIAVTVGFVALFGIFSLLALRAVADSTDRILEERLVIARMAAGELDRLLGGAFDELETSARFARFDPTAASLEDESHLLEHAHGRLGGLSLGVHFLDAQGRLVLSAGGSMPAALGRSAYLRALTTKRRTVSAPFRGRNGRPAVALAVPILDAGGSASSVLVAMLAVGGRPVHAALGHATRLGQTGHAELVGKAGMVIDSTERDESLEPGEHRSFYRRMLRGRTEGVENVPYEPWRPELESRRGEHHVMAFAPLSSVPWGVTVGGTDTETFAPVRRLRRTLLLLGAGSLGGLWALTLVGAALLVRPVRTLTRAAHEMAAGNLERQVRVPEGGEIGVLGESLEAMRSQLKESLETMETKVEQRTAELSTRNRQLAAVTAVATAANEARALEEMVGACLEAVLAHTGMDAAAVRLVDEPAGRLSAPIARGDHSGFPCGSAGVGLGDCPCGVAATTGEALFLGAEERRSAQSPCRARVGALAVLPLRTGEGTHGVLALARKHGDPPGPEERQTLAAICDEIAVAIENAQLLEEVARLEAQREVERMRAELISAVSHEFRTPLGFIKAYATTLLRGRKPVDAGTQRQFLEIIDEEAEKLGKMIDDLLEASRLQAGRLAIDRRPVDLGSLVERAVGKARAALEESGHPVELRLSEDDLRVRVDPMRTEQVLHNLLENAARYSESETAIEVTVLCEDGDALMSVTDHGTGIAEAELERIFEPFYRGEAARARGVRGAGLGLAIARGIVEAQEGRIWVESAVGQGSTFLVALPHAV